MVYPKRKSLSLAITAIRIAVMLFFFLSSAVHGQNRLGIDSIVEVEAAPDEETDEPATYEVGDRADNEYFYKRTDTLTVQERNIPGEAINELKDDKDFWYVNGGAKKSATRPQPGDEPEDGPKGKKAPAIKEQKEDRSSLGQQAWFQTLLWIIIIGGFAVFLVIYLSGSNIGLFRRKNVITTGGEEEELSTEDIFAINYQKEIDKAAAQGNYRLAIRLMFLRLLKNMSEKNIIRYKQDKTNLDYLEELHPTSYYNNFFRIARNYEYSWYGLFPVSDDAYKIIRSDFDQFDKQLR